MRHPIAPRLRIMEWSSPMGAGTSIGAAGPLQKVIRKLSGVEPLIGRRSGGDTYFGVCSRIAHVPWVWRVPSEHVPILFIVISGEAGALR